MCDLASGTMSITIDTIRFRIGVCTCKCPKGSHGLNYNVSDSCPKQLDWPTRTMSVEGKRSDSTNWSALVKVLKTVHLVEPETVGVSFPNSTTG